VLPDDGVLHRNMSELFNVNFNANLKSFLRLSNCASVGEKTWIIVINMSKIQLLQRHEIGLGERSSLLSMHFFCGGLEFQALSTNLKRKVNLCENFIFHNCRAQ